MRKATYKHSHMHTQQRLALARTRPHKRLFRTRNTAGHPVPELFQSSGRRVRACERTNKRTRPDCEHPSISRLKLFCFSPKRILSTRSRSVSGIPFRTRMVNFDEMFLIRLIRRARSSARSIPCLLFSTLLSTQSHGRL